MVSVRAEKAFIRVLNALAELEALSSNDAFAGTEAWVGRLQRRVDRYLLLTSHLASNQAQVTGGSIRALQGKVKDAVASGSRTGVFSAAADLRNELTAHFRSLETEGHSTTT